MSRHGRLTWRVALGLSPLGAEGVIFLEERGASNVTRSRITIKIKVVTKTMSWLESQNATHPLLFS